MDISETFGFTAPPEVVFNSLTDPERANRWLPVGVRAERFDGRLRLVCGGTDAVFDIDTDTGTLAVGWRSVADERLHARVQVADGPAGGSRLHVLVGVPGDVAGEGQVRSALAETVEHLRRDVSDNFTAG